MSFFIAVLWISHGKCETATTTKKCKDIWPTLKQPNLRKGQCSIKIAGYHLGLHLGYEVRVVEGSVLIFTTWGSLTSAKISSYGIFRFSLQSEKGQCILAHLEFHLEGDHPCHTKYFKCTTVSWAFWTKNSMKSFYQSKNAPKFSLEQQTAFKRS